MENPKALCLQCKQPVITPFGWCNKCRKYNTNPKKQKMEEYRKLSDLISESNYSPPEGGMGVISNVEVILEYMFDKYPDINIELSKEEFSSFWQACKDEVLVALLLGKRNMNKALSEGFDFRGIKIRIS